MTHQVERLCCASWCTSWGAGEELKTHYPPRHSDYRDSAPEPLSDVFKLYQPVVQEGRWTEGLLEMWFWKNKPVKHSVHIPCWDSFKWNPLKWRGPCFGRTFAQCYWTGLRQTRWSRAVYAANLGREYVMPFRGVGRHGYKSEIKALCWMYFLLGCIFGCGVGQMASLCGNFLCNFAAWYSCHARERMRRRYNLPPTFCLPPGVDDCLVHFFCMYCASHQEIRELALRGVDGPGMHILDVLPDSFDTVEGIEVVRTQRRALVDEMLARPPKMFKARLPKHHPPPKMRLKVAEAAATLAEMTHIPGERESAQPLQRLEEEEDDELSSQATSDELGLGWVRYAPPAEQEMSRAHPHVIAEALPPAPPLPFPGQQHMEQQQQQQQQQLPSWLAWHPRQAEGDNGGGRALQIRQHSERMVPVLEEKEAPGLQRAWSVAY